MFSALKQGGRPLYRLARQGETVPRAPRPVVIHDLSFLGMDNNKSVTFRAHVSSGTYVRSLVEDVAARAGTVAHVEALRRETVGAWDVHDAMLAEEAATMTAEKMAARFVEHRP